jgi:hypothetical protein
VHRLLGWKHLDMSSKICPPAKLSAEKAAEIAGTGLFIIDGKDLKVNSSNENSGMLLLGVRMTEKRIEYLHISSRVCANT